MARRYVRDAKGRFASKGYTGQTGGRGARLKSGKGNVRAGGGKRENLIGAGDQTMTSLPKGTIGKTQKLRRRATMDMGGQRFAKYEAGKKAAKSEISKKKQEAFFNGMQKKLDAAPLAKTGGAMRVKGGIKRDAKAGEKLKQLQQKNTAANKVSASPRQLTKDQQIARDVMTDKRFKSDRQRRAEMIKRGVKPDSDFVGLVADVRAKQGGGTTGKIKPASKPKSVDSLNAAPLAKTGGREMSKAEFARRTGGKTRDDSMSAAIEMSRQPRGRTKAGDRRNEARLKKIQDDVRATDKAYDAAIKAGRIKPPTRRLADIASGHPDNASVQAARRLQAKAAAKRAARQRGDTAAVNIKMSGGRGRKLDAEISRNVTQQRTAKRAESRARNAQFKSDQSRAKALRGKYGDQLAKDFAAKSGRKVSEVKATIKGMAPSQQVKLLTQAGREQRAKANLARTADTRNQPGSKMIRRPSQKTIKSNLKAEKALEFYKDPQKALKSVNKKRPGFKLPKGMR